MVRAVKAQHLDPMKRLTRRSFLAASAALGAGPAFGAPRRRSTPDKPEETGPPRSGNVDIVVVGAGAAGIAAARRLAASRGLRYVVLEATDQMGGRCITDTKTFGVPYDQGAHWIHAADVNPLARLGAPTALDVYPAPPGQRMRIGRRFAREGELEDFLASLVRTNHAIATAARGKADIPSDKALPKDLGEWQQTIEFVLGPYACGKDLHEVSAVDLSRAVDRDNNAFCRQGLGTLLASFMPPDVLLTNMPVDRIEWWGRGPIEVQSNRTQYRARAVIVTASTNVLLSDKIKFQPNLPKGHLEAASKLKLGSYDHIALELPDNPLGLRADEMSFEKADNRQTASIFGNMLGSPVCMVDVAGSFGRELSAKGEAAMIDFALTWLSGLYGVDMKSIVKRTHATRWNEAPWVMGAVSAAAPGAQPSRKVLMEPMRNRLFLAGEAAHETLWGTVGGAWESGERAAEAALRALGRR
jgi:monoamine oxidase